MRVLIVEDDAELAGLVRDGLAKMQIDVTVAPTFTDGIERAGQTAFDVVILDVMLPGGSGFDLCRKLRERGSTTPVLMLTALDAVDDRVRGLEAGADDYLSKPFAFRELVARVRALARRPPTTLAETVVIADLAVDLPAHRVRRHSRRHDPRHGRSTIGSRSPHPDDSASATPGVEES